MTDLPLIISVDDHVLEPPDLWERWLPTQYLDRAPRVERQRGVVKQGRRRAFFQQTDDGDWADIWMYEGKGMPILGGLTSAGSDRQHANNGPIRYDDLRPGTYQRQARLADMDKNHAEAGCAFRASPASAARPFSKPTTKS
jgi:hypothetical protein